MKKSVKEIPSLGLPSGEGVSMQMLISPIEAPNFAMRKFTIKKGGFMPYHTNSVEHEQYVLSGSAKVRYGDESFIATKDDVLFIPAGVPHSYEVVGDEDYEFLCLIPNLDDKIEMVEGGAKCAC